MVLLGLASCSSPTEQPAATAPTTPAATSTTGTGAASDESPGQPVSLAGRRFRLKSFPVPHTTPNTPPQFHIYLYPSQRTDSVLVAQDTEPSVLDRDQGTRMGVPATAALLFQTYYAGGGYHYYAQAEAHQLRVYRKVLEEASPETEHTPRPTWQLFKTFSFFTTGVRINTP